VNCANITLHCFCVYICCLSGSESKIEAEWILFLSFEIDRIYRIDWMLLSRFHPRPPRLSGSRWRAGGNREKIQFILLILSDKKYLKRIQSSTTVSDWRSAPLAGVRSVFWSARMFFP
jgi:hypothetical protein